MKRLTRRILRTMGFELLHHTDDFILSRLRREHERLRFIHPSDHNWDQSLGEVRTATHLRRLMNMHHIDLVIDIGANTGQYGLLLRELGYKGEICSFEPEPRNLAQLHETAANDPAWRIFPFALGRTAAELELHVATSGDFSSLHAASSYGRSEFPAELSSQQTVRVPVRPLDDVWTELTRSMPRQVLLKSDTQGHDLEVLHGATRSLAHCRAVQVEVAFRALYEDAPSYQATFEFLASAGFQVGGLFPISFDRHHLALIEADAFFIRLGPNAPAS